LAVVEAPGTIGWGWLSDRIGRVRAFVLGSLCVIVAVMLLLILAAPRGELLAWLFALTFSLGDSSRAALLNALAGDWFEGPEYGAISGYLISAFGAGGAVGPWLGGSLFDHTRSYELAFGLGIGATIIATVAIMAAGRERKRAQMTHAI
jgi:OFA family oxalate/formate antiporter-like MFS transporter